LLTLLTSQRSDGAFVSQLDPDCWGMRETVRNALLLLQLGLSPNTLNLDSAVQFILAHQNADGGWCENPALTLAPFMQTFLSNKLSVTWLTADAVDVLRQAGRGDSDLCQAAIKWLRSLQNPHGGWPSVVRESQPPDATGDPDASAQIAFLMREIYGEGDPHYRKGRELFERHLDETARDVERGYRIRAMDGQRQELEVYGLTHLLLSWLGDRPRRIGAGYDVNNPRVGPMMEALIQVQGEDGGWQPFWAEESSPVYTALAVKVLVLTGTLAPEDLVCAVREYAN
jgi:squalene cyclase